MVAEKVDREPTPFGISPEHGQPLCRQPPPTTASRSTAYFPETDTRHEPACCWRHRRLPVEPKIAGPSPETTS